MIDQGTRWRNIWTRHWSAWLLAVSYGGAAVAGEDPSIRKPAAPPIFTAAAGTRPITPSAPPQRATATPMVPSRISELIKAKLPAYTPPVQADETETAADVLKLPAVLVHAEKLKVPDEVQALSRTEFAALLRKRYPGSSNPGQDPYRIEHGAPNYARLQYENDRRQEKTAAFESFSELLERTGDAAAAARLRKELQRAVGGGTYKDPLLDAMDKSANGGRR